MMPVHAETAKISTENGCYRVGPLWLSGRAIMVHVRAVVVIKHEGRFDH